MSLCNRSAQQQQKQQQKHQLNKCKICQNWNLRAEYLCNHKQLSFELTIMLRSLPQCGACDLVWEEQLLLFPWARLKKRI